MNRSESVTTLHQEQTQNSIVNTMGSLMLKVAELNLRQRYDQQLAEYWEWDANHDALTNAYNREGILRLVDRHMSEGPSGEPFGIAFIDLDKFKPINDALGHDGGDHLLISVANQLDASLNRRGDVIAYNDRKKDTPNSNNENGSVGRFGGDEFIVLFGLGARRNSETNEPKEVAQRGEKVSRYIAQSLDTLFDSQPEEVKALGAGYSIGTSIWIPPKAEYKKSQIRDETLKVIKEADKNMYRDKKAKGHSR